MELTPMLPVLQVTNLLVVGVALLICGKKWGNDWEAHFGRFSGDEGHSEFWVQEISKNRCKASSNTYMNGWSRSRVEAVCIKIRIN